ncbi:MAG TPA: M56 family metallopeptidase [Steroidobacteraceae bacterium]|nr:M56 family metallopeptidase [Steroidobacteraceae bacterium]
MLDSPALAIWPLAAWVGYASLKSVAVVLLILLAQKLFARWLRPQHLYALWFALLASLLIPFGAEMDVWSLVASDSASVPHSSSESMLAGDLVHGPAKLSFGATTSGSLQGFAQLSTQTGILIGWAAVALALLAIVGINLFRFRRVKLAAQEAPSPVLAILEQCKARMRVSRSVRVLESLEVASPLIVGWWSPTLLLPQGMATELQSSQLEHVLLHELAHIKRHDIVINWLLTVVQIIHWFNPLLWYALRVMRNDMEKACDADVLVHLSQLERTEYGHTLIKVSDFAPRRPIFAHGVHMVEWHHSLKSRINMIAQFNSQKTTHSIVGVALLTMISAVAVTQPRDHAEEPVVDTAQRLAQTQSPRAVANSPTTADAIVPARQYAQSRLASTPKPSVTNLQTEIYQLTYMQATDLAAILLPGTGIALLSPQGNAAVDERTNALVVRDIAEKIAAVRELVANLDVPLKQVLIEARIAIADDDFVRELRANTSELNSSVATMNFAYDVDAELSAAQANRRAEIISSPKIITLNRREAIIEQGIEAPIVAGGPVNSTTLRISMTPQIRPDSQIAMSVDLVRRSVAANDGANVPGADAPVADQRKVSTQILFKDGQTVIYGNMLSAGAVEDQASPGTIAGKQLLLFLTTKLVGQEAAKAN